jgi:glucokinase
MGNGFCPGRLFAVSLRAFASSLFVRLGINSEVGKTRRTDGKWILPRKALRSQPSRLCVFAVRLVGDEQRSREDAKNRWEMDLAPEGSSQSAFAPLCLRCSSGWGLDVAVFFGNCNLLSYRFSTGMKTTGCAIGLDVGGTKIAGGVVTANGRVVARRVIPTQARRGGDAVLSDALALARSLLAEAATSGHGISAIGVGVGELVDLDGKVVSEQTIGWRGLPVLETFAELAPAVIEADSRAAAYCEARFGAGRTYRIFLYVTVGTGIGSSLVLDGVPYTGARGNSGTLASSPLTARCPECETVLQPVLEQIASGPALVSRYNERAAVGVASAEEVLAAASAGDPRAIMVVRTAGEALGATVGLMINMLDPCAVVVGGGLGTADGLYRESFVASTRQHVWSDTHRDLPIVTASYGSDAGFVGAAAMALQR